MPILRAIARERLLGMVHIDAHCDTGDDYLGSRFHHGASFRRAVEEGLIDPKHVVQIGIRGSLNTAGIWQFSYASDSTGNLEHRSLRQEALPSVTDEDYKAWTAPAAPVPASAR